MNRYTYVKQREDGYLIFKDTEDTEYTFLTITSDFEFGWYINKIDDPVDDAWPVNRQLEKSLKQALDRSEKNPSSEKPTREQAIAAARSFGYPWFEVVMEKCGTIRALEDVASRLWRENRKGPEVETLRKCLNQLDKTGVL